MSRKRGFPMFRMLGTFTLRLLAGVDILVVAAMLLVGMADRVDPMEHSMLSCAGLVFPIFLALDLGFLVFFLLVKRRYALVPFLGLVACYPALRVYCPVNVGSPAPEGSLKVLSYNVYSFCADGAPEGHPNPIMEYICESGADLACIQEGWLSEEVREMAAGTYMYMDSVVNTRNWLSVILLSKYPIVGKERIMYESRGNMSAAFKVRKESDTLTVIVNHFEATGLSLEDRATFKDMVHGRSETDTMVVGSRRLLAQLAESSRTRAPQADSVARYVDACRGKVILCGDFNDSPISYTRRTLAARLTDCYVATGNGPGISYHGNAMYVRIDNMMCSGHFEPHGCTVDRSIGYSDHYPIYCFLEEKRGPGTP